MDGRKLGGIIEAGYVRAGPRTAPVRRRAGRRELGDRRWLEPGLRRRAPPVPRVSERRRRNGVLRDCVHGDGWRDADREPARAGRSDGGPPQDPAQVLERALARRLGLAGSGKLADLVIGRAVHAAADLGERQVFGLQPADQPQSREMALVVLGARSGLADGRQQPLGEVVADGPRCDPGKVRKLGQCVAFVIWHRAIMTVQRDTVKTGSRRCPPFACPNATGPLRSLHIRSTTRLQDSRQTGSTGVPPTDKGVHYMSRVIAAILLVIVLVVGGGIVATTAYNAGVTRRNDGHDHHGRRRHGRHAGRRRPLCLRMAWLRLGLGDLRVLLLPVLPVHRVRRSCGRSSGVGAVAGVGAGAPATDPAAGTATRARTATATAAGSRAPMRRSTTGTSGHTAGPDRPRRASPAPDRRSHPRRRPRPAWPEQARATSLPRAPGRPRPGAHPVLR